MSEERIEVDVEVEQLHIDLGVRGSCATCPLAIAARRALKDRGLLAGGEVVEVAGGECNVYAPYQSHIGEGLTIAGASGLYRWVRGFDLPWAAEAFISAFDNLRPVEPMRFTMTERETA